jgi:hypothetical protein
VAKKNDCHILVKDFEQLGGTKRALAVYNPNDAAKTVQVDFVNLDLAGTVALRDVFAQKDLGRFTGQYEVTVPAHGTRIFVAQAQERLERTRYEAETAYISDYQELKNNQTEKTGIYEYADYCSCGLKAGWLGMSEQNDLQFRDVYSDEGGEYDMTIAYIAGENRSVRIDVNGQRVHTLSLNSGGWATVAEKEVKITLQKGRNIIRLSNSAGWMPDIDYIDLKSTALSGIRAMKTVPAMRDSQDFDLSGRPARQGARLRVQHGKKIVKS